MFSGAAFPARFQTQKPCFGEGYPETMHNKPSPFTMQQGPIPNPALLRKQHTWRRTPDQDEGIA